VAVTVPCMNSVKRSDVILIVDDSPESLSMVNDTLEEAGYNVLVALEGKQALTIARRIRPDMILMDAIMPHKDGFDTCRELRSIPELASVPVIFMTGLTDSASIVKGLEAGGVDYLTKPIKPDELLARMTVHLNNARLTSSAYRALDSAGQFIFSVDPSGKILWATPQTLAMFAKHRADEQWLQMQMPQQIVAWFQQSLTLHPDQSLSLAQLPDAATTFSASPASKLVIRFIQHVSANEVLLKLFESSALSEEELLQQHLGLTKRESQVLLWISNGKTNWEAAQILSMSPRTVNKHLELIFPKLGVQNRTAAAGIAISILKGESLRASVSG